MKSIMWIVLVVIVVLAVWFWFSGQDAAAPLPNESAAVMDNENGMETGTLPAAENTAPVPAPAAEQSVKEFAIEGSNFMFSMSEIKVKKGDKVRIVFTSKTGTHDWRVDQFSAKTNMLGSGKSETVEFVADKAGTFEYYCSVGAHRQMGMKGKLIVEE